jgi:hypothetical protein
MSPKHQTIPLCGDDKELQKRLVKYSAAASLALADSLALPTRPGRADPGITCVDVDPDETVIGEPFKLDFDQDEYPEFVLYHSEGNPDVTGYHSSIGGDAGISFIGYKDTQNNRWASALATSATLLTNPSNFVAYTNWTLGRGASGPWPDQGFKYLGLKFNLNGSGPYYGWAYLSVASDSSSFTIKGYCYNDTQGGSIHAENAPTAVTLSRLEASSGSPSQLPALAAAFGALAGLTAWWQGRVFRRLARRGE